MAITTFAELKTAILNWADVNDSDTVTAADDFVSFSTDMFNYGYDDGQIKVDPLRVREMQDVTDLTPTDGACDLPDDYLQYRRVVELASCRRNLTYIAMTAVEQAFAAREAGLSDRFTIVGGELFMFPTSSNDIELTYYQAIPTLSDGATSNWLLVKRPALYLQAGLFHLGVYRRDNEMIERSMKLMKGLMGGLSKSNFSSEFARATTRLRVAP